MFKGIPPYWRLIDCSFGILGVIPLLICLHHVRQIERAPKLRTIEAA